MSKTFDLIEALCKANHTNITAMCRDLNISRSTLTELKQGRSQSLSAATTNKIARHFNVSVSYLLGESEEKNAARAVTDDEIKFALFGGADDITDEMFNEVKAYAQFVRERKKNGNKGSV